MAAIGKFSANPRQTLGKLSANSRQTLGKLKERLWIDVEPSDQDIDVHSLQGVQADEVFSEPLD
jgi:hypothetical protein